MSEVRGEIILGAVRWQILVETGLPMGGKPQSMFFLVVALVCSPSLLFAVISSFVCVCLYWGRGVRDQEDGFS